MLYVARTKQPCIETGHHSSYICIPLLPLLSTEGSQVSDSPQKKIKPEGPRSERSIKVNRPDEYIRYVSSFLRSLVVGLGTQHNTSWHVPWAAGERAEGHKKGIKAQKKNNGCRVLRFGWLHLACRCLRQLFLSFASCSSPTMYVCMYTCIRVEGGPSSLLYLRDGRPRSISTGRCSAYWRRKQSRPALNVAAMLLDATLPKATME